MHFNNQDLPYILKTKKNKLKCRRTAQEQYCHLFMNSKSSMFNVEILLFQARLK